ncbi:NUDIX domain-containing protein [Candidatus Poribacteria bacterium]|nr:NUDIX domain-containing protein [Candidatus Poribacteria bacterium]
MTSLRIRVSAICRKNDSLLLVEHEKEGLRYWLLPGGGMQAGETAGDAVVRETLEETSLRTKSGRLVCICESVSPDRSRHIVHFLYESTLVPVQEAPPGGSGSLDPRVRRHEFIPVSSLKKLTLYPPIQEWLIKGLSEGFLDAPEYLGALWV